MVGREAQVPGHDVVALDLEKLLDVGPDLVAEAGVSGGLAEHGVTSKLEIDLETCRIIKQSQR